MRTIRGIVIDGQTGERIIGASILLKHTSIGTASDINGKFELEILNKQGLILVVSGCFNSHELKVKSNKYFYKFKLKHKNPAKKSIIANYGLAKILNKNNQFRSSFKIGFKYQFSSFSRIKWNTGAIYNNINSKIGNFGNIEIPLHLNLKRNRFQIESGGNINYIFHQNNNIDSNFDKIFFSSYGGLGFEFSYFLNFKLGIQYHWLKTEEEKIGIINPMIGVVYNIPFF